MTTMQKMTLIATKPEALELAETLMKNKSEANMAGMDTMSIDEIADLVISKFFTAEQPSRYVYTEKGAKIHGTKPGDPYTRTVSKTAIKQYLKAGFIAKAE